MECYVDSLSFEIKDDFLDLLIFLINIVFKISYLDFLNDFFSSISILIVVLIFDFLFFVIEFDFLVFQEILSSIIFFNCFSSKNFCSFDQSIMKSKRIEMNDSMDPKKMIYFFLMRPLNTIL
jgi:hypothetical protein